jgi:hypothetical protein
MSLLDGKIIFRRAEGTRVSRPNPKYKDLESVSKDGW